MTTLPDPANDPASRLPVADEAWTIRPADWERFAAHAGPSAIEHQLRRVKAMRRAAQRDIERLAELLGRRTAELDAGTWPPLAAEEPTRLHAPGMSALTDEEYARLAAQNDTEVS